MSVRESSLWHAAYRIKKFFIKENSSLSASQAEDLAREIVDAVRGNSLKLTQKGLYWVSSTVCIDELDVGKIEREILNILASHDIRCEEKNLGFRRILVFGKETLIGYYVNDHEAAYLKHSMEHAAVKTLVETIQEYEGNALDAAQILIEKYGLTKNCAERVVKECWKNDRTQQKEVIVGDRTRCTVCLAGNQEIL